MGNFLPKITVVENEDKEALNKNTEELKNLAEELLGINGSQFQALYSCITKEAREANNAREQDLAKVLHSIQEKMDGHSKETTTKVSNILKRVEKVERKLVARNSSEKMPPPPSPPLPIDALTDEIVKLGADLHVLDLHMKLSERVADDEMKVLRNYVKDVDYKLDSKLEMKADNIMEELITVKDCVKSAVKSVQDDLKDVTNELNSVKDVVTNLEDMMSEDVVTNLEKDMMSELKNAKEELRVVKEELRVVNEKTRATKEKTKAAKEESDLKPSLKRSRCSRYPTFKQNKRLRNQSCNCGDERCTGAAVPSTSLYPSSTSSSDSDSSFSKSESRECCNSDSTDSTDSSDSDD